MATGQRKPYVAYVEVSVKWYYEYPTCPLSERTWRRVIKGDLVCREMPYWADAERFMGEWHFNWKGFGALHVTYGDGGDAFRGQIADATISIAGKLVPWWAVTSGIKTGLIAPRSGGHT